MSNEPKMQALEELAKAMSKLKLDKLKGYKKTPAMGEEEEMEVEPESETDELDSLPEEEDASVSPFEDEEEMEEDHGHPKGFSQVLEAIARKKAKKH